MQKYLKLTNQLIGHFKEIRFVQISGAKKTGADEIARLASSKEEVERPDLKIEVQKHPSIEEVHIFPIQNKESWMTPILSYIRNGELPLDPKEAERVKTRSSRFTIVSDELYKRGFSLPFLKCVEHDEFMYILAKIHEGVYGDHLGARSLAGKMVRVGYFWLTILKDTHEIIQKCDKCQ